MAVEEAALNPNVKVVVEYSVFSSIGDVFTLAIIGGAGDRPSILVV